MCVICVPIHPEESSWRLRGSEVLRGRAQGKTRRLLPGQDLSSLRRDHAQLFHLTHISVQLHQKDSSQPTSKPLPSLSLFPSGLLFQHSLTQERMLVHISLLFYSRCIQQCLSGRHLKLNPNSTCCVSEKGGRDRDEDKVLSEAGRWLRGGKCLLPKPGNVNLSSSPGTHDGRN